MPFPDRGSYPVGEDEVWFRGVRGAPEIREMSIKAEKNDGQAEIYMSRSFLKGVNMDWERREEDSESTFEIAIKGVGTLLISKLAGKAIPLGGLMFGGALLYYKLVKAYARQNWPVYYLTHNDAGVGENLSYISASAAHFGGDDWPVDTTLTATNYWVFTEQNTAAAEHFIKIHAEVKYYSYKYDEIRTLSTSVELKMTPDISNDFSNPKPIVSAVWYRGCLDSVDYADMYKINIGDNKGISITMTPPKDANYDLYLYNPYEEEADSSTSAGNATESISYVTDSAGYWYIKVKRTQWDGHSGDGIYKLKLTVTSGGGGCPYVHVWNGDEYVIDNNILPMAELSDGADVEDYYKLEQTLVPQTGKYQLLISEFESEHSYLDQIKLLAVDHDSEVNIAVAPDGEILTYKNPVAPLSAVDNNGTNRLDDISFMDGDISDPATYFYGELGDYLILNFGQVNSDNAKLILRDDMKTPWECIYVQVMDEGEWKTVAVANPRSYWSIEGFDLSSYVEKTQDFLVRLFWAEPHRLDFVGLDTTKQEDYELHEANLVSATHSSQGDVKVLLQESDSIYAELTSSQQIQLKFTLPNNSKQARTHILYTKGHYYTITLESPII